MHPDAAIALSFLTDLPRQRLTERLHVDDPELLERAASVRSIAQDVRSRAAATGIEAIAWNDPRFPAQLLAIGDCPPALWYRGSLECLGAPLVAVVGSRAASAVSLEIAARIAADLADRGVTVVSGLARGVDSAAHRGALQKGNTVAVLGSGPDRVYPAEHARLAGEIAQQGVVLSEFPPGTPPLPFHFPLRNRVISGLSRAVVVIEASDKSGSLITASCALEQGREVMAVPGNALSGRNRGGHALIRDGATIVECADDILIQLGLQTSEPEKVTSMTPDGASGDPLLVHMHAGHPYDLDALARATGLDVPRLLPRILEFELAGRIRRVDGGRFIRCA
jgi:DNA processing protein